MAAQDTKIEGLQPLAEITDANESSILMPATLESIDYSVSAEQISDRASVKNAISQVITPISTSFDENSRVFTMTTIDDIDIKYKILGVDYQLTSPQELTLPETNAESVVTQIVNLGVAGLEYASVLVDYNYSNPDEIRLFTKNFNQFDDSNLVHKTGVETINGEKQLNNPYFIAPIGSQSTDSQIPSNRILDLFAASYTNITNVGVIERISINSDLARWPSTNGFRQIGTTVLSAKITGGTTRYLFVNKNTVVRHLFESEDDNEARPIWTIKQQDYTALDDILLFLIYDENNKYWRMFEYGGGSVVIPPLESELDTFPTRIGCDRIEGGGIYPYTDQFGVVAADFTNCSVTSARLQGNIINNEYISFADGFLFDIRIYDEYANLKYWIPCCEDYGVVRACVITGVRFVVFGSIGFRRQEDFDGLTLFGHTEITHGSSSMFVPYRSDKTNNYNN